MDESKNNLLSNDRLGIEVRDLRPFGFQNGTISLTLHTNKYILMNCLSRLQACTISKRSLRCKGADNLAPQYKEQGQETMPILSIINFSQLFCLITIKSLSLPLLLGGNGQSPLAPTLF